MYTNEEITYLIENYNKFTNKELSDYLGRTPNSIERKLSRLGLKKGNKNSWSVEDTNYLKENYSKFTNKELSIKLCRSENSILLKGSKLDLYKDLNHISRKNRMKKLSKYDYVCKICEDYGTNSLHGMSIHLSKIHKNADQSEYYLNNLGGMVDCYFCEGDGKFINLVDGFRDLCDSEECISKSRNTQSVDYLIRQGHSKHMSEQILNQLNNGRSVNGILTIEERLNNNPNFTKEKSPNCKEFYIKRGYSEEVSIDMAADVVLNMQETSHKNRTENPEDYVHTYTTKIEYYLNQGYSEEKSYSMLVDRQTTFSKEICIEKYGEEEGLKVWLNRQEKWHNNYKKSNFSRISQELFQSIWSIIQFEVDSDGVYFASLNKEKEVVHSGRNYEYRLRLNDSYILPDFFIKPLKKIIEFDGTYFHRDNVENKKREEVRDRNIVSNGYEVLHISENDYKQNKDLIVQRCIEFLNN